MQESFSGYWVAGQTTPNVSDVPTTGRATYAGHVAAMVNGGNGIRDVTANFTNTVDFGNKTGQVTVNNLDQTNYSGSVNLVPNDPRYFGGVLAGNTGLRSMVMTGNFFVGPNNPVGEMGGSVLLTGAGNYMGSGIFAGKIR